MIKLGKRKRIFMAEDGTARGITLVAVISIALMLSVGITIAQQTQGSVVVKQTTAATIVDDGCPCHHNGEIKTSDTIEICPLLLEGIQHIQDLGEDWYNQMVQQARMQIFLYQIHQFDHIYVQQGGLLVSDDGGSGEDGRGSDSDGRQIQPQEEIPSESSQAPMQISNDWGMVSSPNNGVVTPLNPYLTWDELQVRSAVIIHWCQGGSIPGWIIPGTNGLIWSIISPDLISCLLGSIFDAGIATIEVLTAIGLFLTGFAFPLALAIAGVSGVQYGIALSCWQICMIKFGG